ncbi:MAG: aspartyl/asparaginyl beta-hydroxylase domain-containing protein [Alphaproteobacteria bacterium]|nr:aspartyl/asparaginyl beta-hydroxylase domain-containing protein [Alphaproteobacteria bacterium]MBU1512752.1 aspartyl/asparaginyl beta-hydroxylase domain-containing protein [Alphaproteobacteria bacterium]MBU2096131.1 aspartyl/asparaginyl beta-hydroxylase domain-containing protein [Alphaproteobacteria bacterium]MBU2152837.1 aspartyl/asparaginyl beta-hydroxylase domain-containing protein [Alphaproteobacteria bacterium]MBU2307979.1 aspartyl/asparaginyl beta-hydroxylase domain-containing protein 
MVAGGQVTSPEQLLADAIAAMRRGDRATALTCVTQAEAIAPFDPHVKMQKAMIHRVGGAFAAALAALDEALALEPYNFLALLSKGAVVEKLSGERLAAKVYENALKLAPDEANMLPSLKAPVARAREVVAKTHEALETYLRDSLGPLDQAGGEMAMSRLDEAIGVYAGRRKVYNHEPLLLHYPRLPAIPFYPRELFPWLPELEAATPMIVAELQAALTGQMDAFAPYIAFPPDSPVNQWEELNHSTRWSSLFLWKDGVRQDAVCARCPNTSALLDKLPMAHQPHFAPTAMFSALDARTHIPAHTGSTNTRLLCHLPLILPGPARFRVGNEVRPWKMGQAWIFDDTIEHEAWNDADELRVILIFDVWNPFLEPGERERISAMMAARNAFYAN